MRKSNVTIWLMVITVFCLGQQPATATLVYDDGGVHNIDWTINESVEVRDNISSGGITTVNLLPDGSIEGGLKAYEHSQINIGGGSIALDLNAYDNSQLTFSGGSIGNNLVVCNNSQATVSGGTIGGTIHSGYSNFDTTTITIIGNDFTIDGMSVGYGEFDTGGQNDSSGWLTGILANGDELNNSFTIHSNASILLEPVPEPATLLLLGLGTLMLRRKR